VGVNYNHSPVAPVDLSQAIIGPGMASFSRYDAVPLPRGHDGPLDGQRVAGQPVEGSPPGFGGRVCRCVDSVDSFPR